MAAQLLLVPLASPLMPALRTGATADKLLHWTPRNGHSDGQPHISSWGAWFLSPRFFGYTLDDVMADSVTGPTRRFSLIQDIFLHILSKIAAPA